MDECESSPCLNAATCVDLENGYRCQCSDGWQGVTCNQGNSHLHLHITSTCYYCPIVSNILHCSHQLNSVIINLIVVLDVDECAGHVCRNAESCENTAGSYTCRCIKGFSGVNCQTNLNDCRGQCLNGGTCIDLIDQYHCACPKGFSGNCYTFLLHYPHYINY